MPQNNRDFNRMQEEALQRMREMQRRSKGYVNSGSDHKNAQNEPPPPKNRSANPAPRQAENGNNPKKRDVLDALLGDIKIDPEKAMILLMLLILYKNKADMKLLLALGYLLI